MIVPGQELGRYRIEALVGQGGMSAVYRAVSLVDGAVVAIKAMRIHESGVAAGAAREVAALRVIDHPAFSQVIEHFTSDDVPYLVMSYVPGEDVATMLARRGGPLPVAEALVWADQLLEALIYLHEREPPILHRDIKPANLKILDGRIVLLDFGLAKEGGDARSLLGYTLTYAPPEQIRGDGTTAQSDLFSLAATTYEILSGQSPPNALRRLSDLAAGRSDPLPPLHSLNPMLPPLVGRLIDAALSLEPGERPASARAMRHALRLAREHAGAERDATVIGGGPPGKPAGRRGILPAAPSALIGREQELFALVSLLGHGSNRLLTITGPGGVGKSRLALAAAERVRQDFDDGAWFIDLAPIASIEHVPAVIATVLGIAPVESAPLREQIAAALQGWNALLLVDNIEHLPGLEMMVAELLAACPAIAILATGRAPLRIRAEREVPLAPLELPGMGATIDPAGNPAMALFVERAGAVRPGFRLDEANAVAVAELCVRLDGLPLAIELAAGWLKLLEPAELLARLERRFDLLSDGKRDLPERQRTLRATLSWSLDLLSPMTLCLFRRLAVFAGGFALGAGEAVANPEAIGQEDETSFLVPAQSLAPLPAPFDGIAMLVEQSLLHRYDEAGTRFAMLQTVRDYALELLVESGEERATRDAHARWCRGLVERAEPGLTGPEQAVWIRRLTVELPNLRAALGWWLERPDPEPEAALLVAALWRFWEIRGLFAEGAGWLESALRIDGLSDAVRARLLIGSGAMARHQGRYADALKAFGESLHLARSTGGGIAELTALGNQALMRRLLGDLAGALEDYEQALELATRAGDQERIGALLNHIGVLRHDLGDPVGAEAHYLQSLAIKERIGDERGIAYVLNNLGLLAGEVGDSERAMGYYARSLEQKRRLGDELSVASTLGNMGLVAQGQGEVDRAIALHTEAIAIEERLGSAARRGAAELNLGLAYLRAGQTDRAHQLVISALERLRLAGERRSVAYALASLARIQAIQGAGATARETVADALRMHRDVGDSAGFAETSLLAVELERAGATDGSGTR